MRHIYLDNNATTQLDPQVGEAIARCWREFSGNPASQHQFGQRARRRLEEARETITHFLGGQTGGMRADQLLFTSGGTESNNLALRGLAGNAPGSVVTSAIEHPSILAVAEQLVRDGFDVLKLPADHRGLVELPPPELLSSARIVSVALANHETGVVQPLPELAESCLTAGVLLHTDAVQAIAKIPVHFRELGLAAMSVSAHKFHGPVGVGALLLRHGVTLKPILHGGFQQQGLRPGTQPVGLAVGMAEALRLWHEAAEQRRQRIADLRNRLETRLKQGITNLLIHGVETPRVPQTTAVAFPEVDRQALVMALDLAGIACSTGSACASGSTEPSGVLLAMGVETALAECSLRFSLSAQTTAAEVDQAAESIIACYQDLRRLQRQRKTPRSPRTMTPKRL